MGLAEFGGCVTVEMYAIARSPNLTVRGVPARGVPSALGHSFAFQQYIPIPRRSLRQSYCDPFPCGEDDLLYGVLEVARELNDRGVALEPVIAEVFPLRRAYPGALPGLLNNAKAFNHERVAQADVDEGFEVAACGLVHGEDANLRTVHGHEALPQMDGKTP